MGRKFVDDVKLLRIFLGADGLLDANCCSVQRSRCISYQRDAVNWCYCLDCDVFNGLVDIDNLLSDDHLRNFFNPLSVDNFLFSLFRIGNVEALSLVSFPFSPDIFLIAWSHSLVDDVRKLSIAEEALVLSIKESE